ncbi:hypothetical protein BDR04DRAFT_1103735 [Suillus decipiens]|nr:hypothetical protein BDR04DRAFT_1103735 [Suillus decipiens]
MKIQREYCTDGPRNQMLWKQLGEIRRTGAKGTRVDAEYIKEVDEGKSVVTSPSVGEV